MSLSSLHLDAFSAVAREKNFSRAAERLYVTQSALSQRISNLEKEIGSALFVREPSGVRLTDLGQRLLRYCRSKESLEQEFLSELSSEAPHRLQGVIRVAGFSTVTRSVLLPALAELIADHPSLLLELRTEELRDLPGLLTSGATDFIFGYGPLEKQGIENVLVGHEENLMIQSSRKDAREDVYLDNDEHDDTTFQFFKHQGRKTVAFKRSYVGDIDGILDAVKLGVGRAVIPRHLIKDKKGFKVSSGFKTMKLPVYLSYYTQAFYTEVQKAVVSCLTKDMKF